MTAYEAVRVGSSPLARGTLTSERVDVHVAGLIPARAGNTALVGTANQIVGAHPRSRGEHRGLPRGVSPPAGSSPLARGTQFRAKRTGPHVGLIPARAGNTVPDPP